MVFLARFNVLDFALQLRILALNLSDLLNCLLTICSIQSRDQLRDQVRMLRCIGHSWQDGTGDLTLSRLGAILCAALLVQLTFQILLGLFLHQRQVQVAQRIGTQSAGVIVRVLDDERDALELIGDFVETKAIRKSTGFAA
jgi:hypothetical protein